MKDEIYLKGPVTGPLADPEPGFHVAVDTTQGGWTQPLPPAKLGYNVKFTNVALTGSNVVTLVTGGNDHIVPSNLAVTVAPGDSIELVCLKDGVWAQSGVHNSAFVPTAKSSTGIQIPSDWGTSGGWNLARSAAGSRRVNVVGFGASIMAGFYSSNWGTKSWFGALVAALQAQYGDGGSGANSMSGLTGVTAGSASAVTTAGGTLGTATGGIDKLAAALNTFCAFPHAALNGASITVTGVRGSTIQIVYYPSATGTMGVSVDGVAASGSPFNCVGAGTQLQVINLPTTPGTHTVVVTFPTGQAVLADVRGLNATGVVGYNYSLAGRASGDVSTASSLTNAGWTTTGAVSIQQMAPDLFIYGADVGINDISAASTAIAVAKNAALAFDYAKAGNPQCDILVVAPHRGNTVDSNELYPSYVREFQALAAAYGAAFVDFWPIGRNAYAVGSSLGYWGDGTNDGLPGSNTVHLSDAGHAAVQSTLLPLLTAGT